jgi:Fur family peroxide stress response transcriptional regulator
MSLTAVRRALAEKGLPVTHQRLAVYEALHASHDHPSAEALHVKLKKKYPSLSLATVYKTLQTFQKLGLATLVNYPHVEARYDAITHRHHHAICEKCGKIEDLFDEKLDSLPPPRAKGFKATSHSVHFRGLCESCQRR